MGDVSVRRIEPSEWQRLKEVRLAALHDAPYAFSSTFEDESIRPDSAWIEWAALGADGPDRCTLFAFDDNTGTVLGLAGGNREGRSAADVDLESMWTARTARRRGAARALVLGIVEWARATGASAVALWVTRGNEPAEALYRSLGFVANGEFQPLPSDPCKDEVRMILRVEPVEGFPT